MDRNNAAVSSLTQIPPALLERISQDAGALAPWVRVLLATHLDQIDAELAQDPTAMTVPQKLEFLSFLAKIGDVYPKAAVQGGVGNSGFSVNIILNKAPKTPAGPKPLVIDNE